ncbi:hypothetical protein [Prosthecodimorpha staleyi]|uniref:Uncharacterized protein n=1 Tax=Prosthecodimorpha staleyi TaxID=2840188 RepID=A0A947D5X4_9HYPH|nr:hypothetical protein [Prosthecodimorpha staleyi]MBT9288727.1 hypothetical protein [Prosthecodimorpha staleyi]
MAIGVTSGTSITDPQFTTTTIPQSSPTGGTSSVPAVPTGATYSTSDADSQYLSLPFARLTLENLGLSPSSTFQDVSVLLDQVAMALDKLFEDNDKERIKGENSIRRGALADILSLKSSIDTLTARNAELDQIIADGEAEKTDLQGQRSDLVSQQTSLTNQINTLNDQIANTSNPTTKAQLVAQRDGLVTQRNAVNAQIGTVDTKIAAADKKINDAQTEKTANENTIASLEQQITTLASQLSQTLAAIERLLAKATPTSGVDLPVDELVAAAIAFDSRFADVKAFEKLQKLNDQDTDTETDILRKVLGQDGDTNLLPQQTGGTLPPSGTTNGANANPIGQTAGSKSLAAEIGAKAVALVEALTSVLKTLAALEPPPKTNLFQEATTNGSRMRLSV